MYFEHLGRHLSISSLSGAQEILARDGKGFWNVISILSPDLGKPLLRGAKKVVSLTFDDTINPANGGGWVAARPQEISRAFVFWDDTFGEPMLIHCLAGLSRSTGLALSLIVREIWGTKDLVKEATGTLLAIRPQACPNAHVLQLGLEQFLSKEISSTLAIELADQPEFIANRLSSRE